MKQLTLTFAALCAATVAMAQAIAPAEAIRTCATPSAADYVQIENPNEVFSTLNDQWTNRVGEYRIQHVEALKKQVNQPIAKSSAPAEQGDMQNNEQAKAYAQKLSEMAMPLLSESDIEKLTKLDSKSLLNMLNKKIKDAGQTPPNPADYGVTDDMLVSSAQDSRAAEDRFGDEYAEMENQMEGYHAKYQQQIASLRQQALNKMTAISTANIKELKKKISTEIIGKGADNSPYTGEQYEGFRKQLAEATKNYKTQLYQTWINEAIKPAQKASLEYNDILAKWEGMKAKMYQLNLETYQQAWGEYGYNTICEDSFRAWQLYATILFQVIDTDEFLK